MGVDVVSIAHDAPVKIIGYSFGFFHCFYSISCLLTVQAKGFQGTILQSMPTRL